MDVPNGAALHKYNEGRREDRDLSLEELGEKYRGVKTLEHMIRRSYEINLEDPPSEVQVGQELQNISGNAYSVPPWNILAPVDGLEHESMPEILAEETGHNIDKLNRRDIDLDGNLMNVYREFAAAAMRDEIFEGNIQAPVTNYRETRDELDEFYSTENIIDTIQSDIENIMPLAERTLELAESLEYDPELANTYTRVLIEEVDGKPPEVEPINSTGKAIFPIPAVEYQKQALPQYWLTGDIREHESPEETLSEIENDKCLDREEFASKYSELIEDIHTEARKAIGFDIPHIVGREIWVRNSNDLTVQDVMNMPASEVEKIIKQESQPIIEEYRLGNLEELACKNKISELTQKK